MSKIARSKNITRDIISRVWETARKIKCRDPRKYRQDVYGNVLCKSLYGKNKKMGWEIDHIVPKLKRGPFNILNMQVLQMRVNRRLKDFVVKRNRHQIAE